MILDTDYKTYAAVFSCDDLWFNVERYINAWVITRERDHYKAKEAVSTLYIGYTAIGYGAKSVKGWVLGCPDLSTAKFNRI